VAVGDRDAPAMCAAASRVTAGTRLETLKAEIAAARSCLLASRNSIRDNEFQASIEQARIGITIIAEKYKPDEEFPFRVFDDTSDAIRNADDAIAAGRLEHGAIALSDALEGRIASFAHKYRTLGGCKPDALKCL